MFYKTAHQKICIKNADFFHLNFDIFFRGMFYFVNSGKQLTRCSEIFYIFV